MASGPDKTELKADGEAVGLGGTRAHALQRLQVGLSLLIGVILIVGLANVIEQRAKLADDSAVPQAAATVEPSAPSSPTVDPLADAGVVPDIPAKPTPLPAEGRQKPIQDPLNNP